MLWNARKQAAKAKQSQFHLDRAAFYLSEFEADAITWRELCEGVACLGSAGSGKSSIVAKALFKLVIRSAANVRFRISGASESVDSGGVKNV